MGDTTDISNFQRIVEEGTEQPSAVLEELVYSEESNLSQLRRIWDSGIIKEEIKDEMVRQLKVLANQIIFIAPEASAEGSCIFMEVDYYGSFVIGYYVCV